MSHIVFEFEDKRKAIPYPEHPKKPIRENFANNTEHGKALDEYDKEKEAHREQKIEYYKATKQVDDEFKKALAKELGLTGHPKFEQLYDIAYEDGHSEGYNGIYNSAWRMAPLLEETKS